MAPHIQPSYREAKIICDRSIFKINNIRIVLKRTVFFEWRNSLQSSVFILGGAVPALRKELSRMFLEKLIGTQAVKIFPILKLIF